jgi:hypothetical protein
MHCKLVHTLQAPAHTAGGACSLLPAAAPHTRLSAPTRYCAAADLQALQGMGIRSYCVLPVMLGREVLGALCVASPIDNAFLPRWVAWLGWIRDACWAAPLHLMLGCAPAPHAGLCPLHLMLGCAPCTSCWAVPLHLVLGCAPAPRAGLCPLHLSIGRTGCCMFMQGRLPLRSSASCPPYTAACPGAAVPCCCRALLLPCPVAAVPCCCRALLLPCPVAAVPCCCPQPAGHHSEALLHGHHASNATGRQVKKALTTIHCE